MKKIISCVFIGVMVLSNTVLGDISQLQKGIVLTPENENTIVTTSIEYARADINHDNNNDGVVVSFFRQNNTDNVFSLARKSSLYLTDFSNGNELGRWSLNRWLHENILPEITTRLAEEATYEPEPVPVVKQLAPGELPYGCLSQTPLRYGDADGNGDIEIVLLMDQDIIFFSVDKQKILFQLRWIDEREDGEYADASGVIEDDPDDTTIAPQFRDPYVNGPLYKGLRAYAKLYMGEFNNNQTPDIIVWYKVYQSNMDGELAGFAKIRDSFKHYELITSTIDGLNPTGEYLPLSTSENDVQQWLIANNLTWQKGYPSISECSGQAGQLIPEIHDPLLNDPDVLK